MNKLNNFKIVVPIFDEFENLKEFINILIKNNQDLSQFCFVDNGSTDIKINDLLNKYPVHHIASEENLGFGGGIKLGINNVNAQYVCWMPCNLKVDPISVLDFIQDINKPDKNTLYKAIRAERPLIDTIKTLIFSFLQSVLLKSLIYDSGGTPTLVHKSFFGNLENFPNDYQFETYVVIKAKINKLNIRRVKVKYGKRKFGKSHWQNGILSELNFIKNMYTSTKNWKF